VPIHSCSVEAGLKEIKVVVEKSFLLFS